MKKFQKIMIIVLILINLINASIRAQSTILAPTPPMGWMSWYTFIDNINEELIMEVADSMVSSGLRDAGYTMLQLDDGWMAMSRDQAGRQYADTSRFPHGMKFLGDYLHARGLKLGSYSSAGSQTCEGYPGSYNHEEIDASTYAEWGVDYLKYDACGEKGDHSDKELYYKMSKALKETGRPILYEVCIFYSNDTHLWGAEIADMWRTGGDIVKYIKTNPEVTCKNWYENLNQVIGKEDYAGNGHWNDPDNLIVGYPRNNKQTFEEQKAQFSFWCLIAAPLLLSVDVRNITPEIKSIILNNEVIAISQDKAGIQGKRIKSDDNHEVWIKNLNDGSKAIILFNKKEESSEVTFSLTDINETGKYMVRDLWEHANKGMITDSYSSIAAPHGVVMVKISK
jgi:alpha-galactosidase